jgi:hypothetical protein
VANGDRPQYQHGVGTIGGAQFHWGSGAPGQYWSIPYGDYPVTPDAPTGAWAHQVGAIPIANNVIPDPLLHRNRIGIMIHSGSADSLDQLYTQGCFKVAPQEWPAVRTEILSEAAKGPLYLHVQPGGVASFTNTKTLGQASIPTADAPGPAVSASNAPIPGAPPSQGNRFLDALAQIESNNQNIFSKVDKDYPGQAGSRSQGNFQIDVPTWQQFAPKAGVDVGQYPAPMNAPREVQAQVASQIPFSRFGSRTQRMMGQQFGPLDASKTVGELAQAGAGPGPIDPSIIARGGSGPPIPDTPGTTLNATAAAPARGLFGMGEEQSKALVAGAKALTGKGKDDQGDEPIKDSPFVGPPSTARNVSQLGGQMLQGGIPAQLSQAVTGYQPPQMYGTGLTSMSAPPPIPGASPGQNPWTDATGQPIGVQAPGVSLNTQQQGGGMSFQRLQELMQSDPYGASYG